MPSYVALDEKYISADEFKVAYELAGRTRAAIRGFINYLVQYEKGGSKVKGKFKGSEVERFKG